MRQANDNRLCNGFLYPGDQSVTGLVFNGDGEAQPQILSTLDVLIGHCERICKQEFCTQTQRDNILNVFQEKQSQQKVWDQERQIDRVIATFPPWKLRERISFLENLLKSKK